MKKTFLILISMILVFSIGQAVFADYEVGLIVGYGNKNKSYDYYQVRTTENFDTPILGIYTNHELKEGFSISSKGLFSIGKLVATMTPSDGSTYRYDINVMEIAFDLFLKINIITTDSSAVGIQFGIMDDYMRITENSQISNKVASRNASSQINKLNIFFGAVGIFADVKVGPKAIVYGDLKLPVLSIANDSYKSFLEAYNDFEYKQFFGFFKSFLYDLTLGFKYDLNENVCLGIEGSITNATVFDFSHRYIETTSGQIYANTFPSFNIGATLGYKF